MSPIGARNGSAITIALSATKRSWPVTPALLSDALAELAAELEPEGDQQASVSMRRHLAKLLLVRCVAALLGRPDLAAGASG